MWEQKSSRLLALILLTGHILEPIREGSQEGGVIVPRSHSWSVTEQIQGRSLTPVLKRTYGVLVYVGDCVDRERSALV